MADIQWKEIGDLGWISEPNVPIFKDINGRNFILCHCRKGESGETVIEPIRESFEFKSNREINI
jgi:hypothetical protein